jgi:hypothetical protein
MSEVRSLNSCCMAASRSGWVVDISALVVFQKGSVMLKGCQSRKASRPSYTPALTAYALPTSCSSPALPNSLTVALRLGSDRVGHRDGGRRAAGAQGVVGVTVSGAVGGAVGVVVVDQRVVGGDSPLLGQAGQRVVLRVEAQDGPGAAVGGDEGGREADGAPFDGESVVLEQTRGGE